jgi:hypothetical protein
VKYKPRLFILVIVLGLLAIFNHSRTVKRAPASGVDCALKTADLYPTVNIRPTALEKDRTRNLQQYYFSGIVREEHRFIVAGGVTYNYQCAVMKDPDGGGPVNYVMDADGNFYWVDENKNPSTRHSAVFDAGPVAGAGNITITDSKIVSIDSDSGHYPSGPVFSNVLKQLQLEGVDLHDVHVTRTKNDK